MRPFGRSNEPVFLSENASLWGQEWKQRRHTTPNAQFRWPKLGGQPVNHLLLPLLAGQTQWHCSYCDCNEIGTNEESIDHFRPKSNPAFCHLAFSWSNLYYVCWNCQKSKMETWSDEYPLLAPDEADYAFQNYSIFNFRTGEIEPNTVGTTEFELARAKFTIDTFGLRDFRKHCKGRLQAVEKFRKESSNADFNLDDHPYRFLFALLTD